jgi:hypothetical protein
MAVELHRCGNGWIKGPHPCWIVEKALQDAGVDYQVKAGPLLPRSRRTAVIEGTGQNRYPAIRLEDGTWWRDESRRMAEEIRAGKLSTSPPAT